MRYVTGVVSAALAAAILYFAFASVSASSVPGGSDQPTRVTTGLSAPRGG
jgi:hypothetical protein